MLHTSCQRWSTLSYGGIMIIITLLYRCEP
ncbi:ATPase 8 [Escherichia phage IMM-002]|uniref:ATPase 8 n=1 Tax=Escherichia phage IMM-002 TaxID=2041760 RepID=A0A384WIQ9_9CAUD|nr:ATPase 8 [Escherichia phage IMM-002]ATI17038.1 ATPase 8 [Escherichia phage IMM-002]